MQLARDKVKQVCGEEGEGKLRREIPKQAWAVKAPRFQDNRHTEVVRLSTLHTGRFYPQGSVPGTYFC